MSTRKRGINFSSTEKLLLIEIITKYKNIIENKRTDAVYTKEKGTCWDEISKQFNSESNIFRDVLTLKNCWENLKKKTRKYYAEEKQNLYKTGKTYHNYYIFIVKCTSRYSVYKCINSVQVCVLHSKQQVTRYIVCFRWWTI